MAFTRAPVFVDPAVAGRTNMVTGANEDGAAGLARIGIAGGMTAVQDPDEAMCPDMPRAALRKRAPNYVLTLKDIALLIAHLELPA